MPTVLFSFCLVFTEFCKSASYQTQSGSQWYWYTGICGGSDGCSNDGDDHGGGGDGSNDDGDSDDGDSDDGNDDGNFG